MRTLAIKPLAVRRYSTRLIMVQVMLALIPGTALSILWNGPGVLLNIVMACLCAALLEAIAVALRGRSVSDCLGDCSIVLAAWLLALALPAMLPFWQLMIGVLAMVWLGKHVFGGLGQNPFNPAMVGYAVLIISFPQTMTLWLLPEALSQPDLQQLSVSQWWQIKLSASPSATLQALLAVPTSWDALTGATPLDQLSTTARAALSSSSAEGYTAVQFDSHILWTNLAFLTGGLWLLWRKVVRWHIPVSVLGSLALLHATHGLLSADPQPALHLSLLSGAAIIGAFFIATDPVSAATSNRGRLIYGAGIGCLCFLIREFGGYPEGMAFAVLIMNATVPMIDHFHTPERRS